MKKILHIISGIGTGGAERVLYNLTFHDKTNIHSVISLKKKNYIETPYRFNHLNVVYLDISIFNFFYKIFYLSYLIFKTKPMIVQTWMYHADFFGGLAAKLVGIKHILWNIRNSNIDKNTKFTTKLILKLNIFLSYFIPNQIICCSLNAIKIHKSLGYKKIFIYIPNGINLNKKYYSKKFFFVKSPNKKNLFIISYVGRWHPQKDFCTLFRSLKILKYTLGINNWKILIAGYELNKLNTRLYDLIRFNSLQNEVIVLGQVYEIDKIYKNSDLNILTSSYGEAFPNVILEAMSNETPCIATDVGESRSIILNNGWCVKKKNPLKFAFAIKEAIFLKKKNPEKWNELKLSCKTSIKLRFGLDKMILRYNKLWNKNF